ncbi:MAG: Rrf2 family transcriptional regulator [Oscillospiraceae bacterium]|nr:Rrf2 family transcriptional regulator [Oscillospiraceae bacterium]
MRLQISTDYAIRILRHLYRNDNELHTASSIAESIDVTYYFFAQIANQLKRKGLLKSTQGRKGGYQLGREAHEISLYDVYECIEGELLINRCLIEGKLCSHGETQECKMHKLLYGVQDTMIAAMAGVTLADLAA